MMLGMSDTADEKVYLQYGEEEHADGELVARKDLPEGAYPTVLGVDGAHVGGKAGVLYDVWVVEVNDVDYD